MFFDESNNFSPIFVVGAGAKFSHPKRRAVFMAGLLNKSLQSRNHSVKVFIGQIGNVGNSAINVALVDQLSL